MAHCRITLNSRRTIMVLSIGMIVKNEEKYLGQCLTALQPILDELDSELIIADTGSTDRTVEIAKRFTDNVFYFEWINDFAAARNSTIEKAKGEWYMFIDADEVAVDCTDFIRFFKSGEYKKYCSANYIVKSYMDVSDSDSFSEARPMRLAKNEPGLKFVGRTHEAFSLAKAPTKFLDFTVDHYGYFFYDNGAVTELAIEKNKRNLEGLFKDLEDKDILKRNPHIYGEIADCYFAINDYENASKYIDRGLRELPHDTPVILQYYIKKIMVHSRMQDMEAILAACDEYFDKKKNPWHNREFSNDCLVYYYRGYAYYKTRNYRAAIPEFVRTFELYKKYKQNKLNTGDLMYDPFRLDVAILKVGYDIFFRCCYQEKQFALANEYTKAIPLEKYFGDESFMANHLNIRIEMMENLGYNDLDELYRQLDEFGKTFLLIGVRRRTFTTSPENRAKIVKKLTALDGMPAEIAKIYNGYFDAAPDYELIKDFLEKYGSENSEDILLILLENRMDISPFLLTDDFFADRAAQIIIRFFPHGIDVFENYDIGNISPEGLERATSLYGYVMLRAMEQGHTVTRLFETYGELGMSWIDAFEGNVNVPGDIRAAMYVYNVVSAKKSGSKERFTKYAQNLKSVVSDLIPLVDTYEAENREAFNNARRNPEFEQLAAQVKRNIRELISAGNIGDARKLIREFEGISPDDPDIEALKNEINNSLQ